MWWIELRQFDESLVKYLGPAERTRLAAFVNERDRRRFAIGAAAVRLAAARYLDARPSAVWIDRMCSRCGAGNGKPRLPDTGMYVSVSHSGALMGVALAQGVDVGLDVEGYSDRARPRLAARILADDEERPSDTRQFLRYWTRKESAVKATGDGLSTDLVDVIVTGAGEPAALLRYAGTNLAASMIDLDPLPDHCAALTVLAPGGVDLTEHWGGLPI